MLEVIILGAGKGTRMHSHLPKVLHPLAGRPMIEHVVATASRLSPENIHVVVGHGADEVERALAQYPLQFHHQAEQLGTGHALAQALPHCHLQSTVLVLFGDVPLISTPTLQALLSQVREGPGVLAAHLSEPSGYGRILRDDDQQFVRVVEERDATDSERRVQEVNTGVMACPAGVLSRLLSKVGNNNAQQETYLPDVLAVAREERLAVSVVVSHDADEIQGVNNRLQLEALERTFQQRFAEQLLTDGVAVADRSRLDVRGQLTCGYGVSLDINTLIEGVVVLADNVQIGANCVIRDVSIGPNTIVHPFSHIEDAVIGADCSIGPYARIRPGSRLGPSVRIGNFVETKKATLGAGSKANHLAYIGDATIGEGSNIGAGSITCNYDGANKHHTQLGDGVFIGSNSTLVAPVTIADGGFIAAGSVITKDVAAAELAVGRGRQRNIADWQAPKKDGE
mgnify:CR=1 FL=1